MLINVVSNVEHRPQFLKFGLLLFCAAIRHGFAVVAVVIKFHM